MVTKSGLQDDMYIISTNYKRKLINTEYGDMVIYRRVRYFLASFDPCPWIDWDLYRLFDPDQPDLGGMVVNMVPGGRYIIGHYL